MLLCTSCSRHVRARAGSCPFCKARLGVVAGLAAAVLAGCEPPPQAMPVYGAPVPPSASPSASPAPGASLGAAPMRPPGGLPASGAGSGAE